jgi:dienelactone hydrolase
MIKKFIFSLLISLFLFTNASAQVSINPFLGWSWNKQEFSSTDIEKTKLYLHFKLQSNSNAPSVLIGHDNGGISNNEINYADFLYAKGFNVFVTDRVTSRKRVASPLESFLIHDTFSSLSFIKSEFKNRVDVNSISYVSFSGDGGFGGLMAIEPKARIVFNPLNPDSLKFHKVVVIYPHCLHMKDRNPDTPTLIIGAELDGSDPIVCQKAYTSSFVTVDIYKGAYHGFDQSALKQKTWISKPVLMPGTCEWTIDLEKPVERQGMHYFMLFNPSNDPQNSLEFSRYNQTCLTNKSGYFSEYREDLTRQAYNSSLEFLKK